MFVKCTEIRRKPVEFYARIILFRSEKKEKAMENIFDITNPFQLKLTHNIFCINTKKKLATSYIPKCLEYRTEKYLSVNI